MTTIEQATAFWVGLMVWLYVTIRIIKYSLENFGFVAYMMTLYGWVGMSGAVLLFVSARFQRG